MHQLNLTGIQFGSLVAITRIEGRSSLWLCRCNCGKEKAVRTGNLRSGTTISCGCRRKAILDAQRHGKSRHSDLLGKRFGRWLILSYISSSKDGASWLCRCGCGVERGVLAKSLLSGASTSCGCLCVEKSRKEPGRAAQTELFHRYRHNCAKKRGLEWGLSREDFNRLTQLSCHYCGRPRLNTIKSPSGNGSYLYSGLDRMDNCLGYVLSNVVPCCWICQRAKMDIPYPDFLKYLDILVKFRKRE